MTLLIACILIYHFDMSPWWYAFAGLLWTLRAWAIDAAIKSNVAAIRHYVAEGKT